MRDEIFFPDCLNGFMKVTSTSRISNSSNVEISINRRKLTYQFTLITLSIKYDFAKFMNLIQSIYSTIYVH